MSGRASGWSESARQGLLLDYSLSAATRHPEHPNGSEVTMSSNIPVSFLTDFIPSALTVVFPTLPHRRWLATAIKENKNPNTRL